MLVFNRGHFQKSLNENEQEQTPEMRKLFNDRWFEYSISASIMLIGIALGVGIREQNTLALLFMSSWCTMIGGGFFTELYSRPKVHADLETYSTPRGPDKQADYNNNVEKSFKVDYEKDGYRLKIINQARWEGDRTLYDVNGKRLSTADELVEAQSCNNYVRRMLPHVYGWFPYSSAWVVILIHLRSSQADLAVERPDVQIPAWVEGAIYGTVLMFTSFAFVQIIFQSLPPGFYWGSEVVYCILSLVAKLYLGWFLLLNVIFIDGSAEAALTGSQVSVDMQTLET